MCSQNCKDFYALKNYSIHTSECKLENCKNFEVCKSKAKFVSQNLEFCSQNCFLKLTQNKSNKLTHKKVQ